MTLTRIKSHLESVPPRLLLLPSRSIIIKDTATQQSQQRLYDSEAEAMTALPACDSCQKLTSCLAVRDDTLHEELCSPTLAVFDLLLRLSVVPFQYEYCSRLQCYFFFFSLFNWLILANPPGLYLSYEFGSLDHFQPYQGVSFIVNTAEEWADSEGH